jgi:hypothetical protein
MDINWEHMAALPSRGSVSGAATGVISSKAGGRLVLLILANTGASVRQVAVYDNTAASGTKLMTITCPANFTTVLNLWPGIRLSTGLTIVSQTDMEVMVAGRAL